MYLHRAGVAWSLQRQLRTRWPRKMGSQRGQEISLFATESMQRNMQPPTYWLPKPLSVGIKRSGRDADHSPITSAEVKNTLIYTSIPLCVELN
jgi:hypothetical protein